MNNKVIRFPVTSLERKKNEMGAGYVPCMVSERWLQFNLNSSQIVDDELIMANLMTLDKNESPYKICELVFSKQDLLKMLSEVKTVIK